MQSPMASSSITNSARLKAKLSSDPRGRVRIVGKIRGFTDLEALSSDGVSAPWVSVQKSDGVSSDGVAITFVDQNNSRRDVYKLDYCYGQDEDVEDMFTREVKPLLAGVFNGLSTSVLAYGARGSGKTYLIQGSESKPGLVSLAMAEILSTSEEKRHSISMSYYEVHQEHIYDLLEPKKEITILENAGGKIQLKGLSQVPVKSISEFHKIYYHNCVAHKPTPKVTIDPEHRSHKGLMIHISSHNEANVSVVAKINFVDLAGYEDTKRKSNGGPNLGETALINKSLYTLQNVVKALNTSERVPYRESKLTRMLQDSFGGKNQALMVTCLNPVYCQDTLHTVSLASRSCQITNQDSTKKNRTMLKSMPVPSPKVGRPQSVPSSLKKQTDSKPRVMEKKSYGPSSALKGRKLFDGSNPASSSTMNSAQETALKDYSSIIDSSRLKEENTSSDSISYEVSLKPQDQETLISTVVKEIETTTEKGETLLSATTKEIEITIEKGDVEHLQVENTTYVDYQDKVVLVKEEKNSEKENKKSLVNESGSPPLSERLRELSNALKFLEASTPINSEIVKKWDPLDDQVCSVQVEPKTPKSGIKMELVNYMEVPNSCTPREAYSIRTSGIKESLVQEYLKFVNTASKEELKQVKGIGERRANYIMELREKEPFKDLDDLKEIGLTSKDIQVMMRKVAGDLFI